MTQATSTIPANVSGTGLRTLNNSAEEAQNTQHRGSSRPTYLTSGLWLDDSANPSWVLKLFDGTDDITCGTFNVTTNTFYAANSATTNGSTNYAADSSASANTVTISTSPARTAYTVGESFRIKLANSITDTATLNVDGLGAKTIKKNGSSNLENGDFIAGQMMDVIYDGTYMQVIGGNTSSLLVYNSSAKTSLVNADKFFISNSESSNLNGSITYANLVAQLSSGLKKGEIIGPLPSIQSVSTVRFPSGLQARDDSNTVDIILTGNIDVSLAVSGAAGLDTGSEAANTKYYYWLIRKSSDGTVSVIASTSATSPTMPSGYDQKRLMPFMVVNDASSNIINGSIVEGWPYCPKFIYNTKMLDIYDYPNGGAAVAGSTNVKNNSAVSSTWTAQSLSALMPSFAQVALLHVAKYGSATAQHSISFRATGETHTGIGFDSAYATANAITFVTPCFTNSSQSIDYWSSDSGVLRINVLGWTANNYTNGF